MYSCLVFLAVGYVHGLCMAVCHARVHCVYVCVFEYSYMLMPGISGCVECVHMYLMSPSVIVFSVYRPMGVRSCVWALVVVYDCN